MVFNVKLSRLLRKKALDTSGTMNRPSVPASSQSRTMTNAVLQLANSPMVVGYFVIFAYSAQLAPSTLLAVVFVASITSLLSELCRYEFLTCRRNTSFCPYTCTYQTMGEFAAHLYGWTQILSRSAIAALVARGIGSVLILIFGKRLIQYEFSENLVNEDTIGAIAQTLVSIFVLLGLKMTKPFSAAIKLFILLAILLFISQTQYFPSSNVTLHGHSAWNTTPIFRPSRREDFLMSVALLSTLFKPENKEPKILSMSSMMSAFIGIQYCSTLLILVILSIALCFLPTNLLGGFDSGSPLLEILVSTSADPHWSAAVFACCCILVGSLSLVESVQDSKRHIIKMSSDGLILKKLAAEPRLALVAHCLISIPLQLTVSTFHLIIVVVFMHLCVDSVLGLVVTYRRYCGSSRQFQSIRNIPRSGSQGYNILGRQQPHNGSDSDETDIDAAVDDYRTQVYISTVMQWNGSQVVNCPENDIQHPVKTPYLLLGATVVIGVMSLAMRYVGDLNLFSISVSITCFVAFNVVLFVLWTWPQKLGSSNPIFKVPCVPWIPLGSSLFHSILLFQLPAYAWIISLFWLIAGLVTYFGYGYRKSRLNFKVRGHNNPPGGKKTDDMWAVNQQRLRISPEVMSNVTSSSIAVYPQPFYSI